MPLHRLNNFREIYSLMIVSMRSKSHGSDLGMVHEGFLSWQLQKEVKLKFDLTKSWCIFDVNREIELDLGY